VPKGGRGVRCVALSSDKSQCALVDMSNNHNVFVFDVNSGSQLYTATGDSGDIIDVAYTQKSGEYNFVTAGVKHIKFWNANNQSSEKGLLGGKGELTNFLCCAYDSNGLAFTGGLNSLIYVWQERNLQQTLAFHKSGSVSSMTCQGTKLMTGGKDGFINIIDTTSLQLTQSIEIGAMVKGLDITSSGDILYGTNTGIVGKTTTSGQKT
jgi:WD40 repeat protein